MERPALNRNKWNAPRGGTRALISVKATLCEVPASQNEAHPRFLGLGYHDLFTETNLLNTRTIGKKFEKEKRLTPNVTKTARLPGTCAVKLTRAQLDAQKSLSCLQTFQCLYFILLQKLLHFLNISSVFCVIFPLNFTHALNLLWKLVTQVTHSQVPNQCPCPQHIFSLN